MIKNRYFSDLSDAAATFLTVANYQEEELIVAENLPEMRRRNWHRDKPAFTEIQEKYCSLVVEDEIAGVPCLSITPKHLDLNRSNKVMLYFYGGGYMMGSPEEDLVISAVLAEKLGMRVLSPRYSLAPENIFPIAHDECMLVYGSLVEAIGAQNIIVAGESAGGNMSVSLLLHAHQDGLPMPAAVALLSPWIDLSCDAYDAAAIFPHDSTLPPQYIEEGSKIYSGSGDPSNPLISPLHGEFGDWFPPVILTTGTGDCLQHMTRRLAEKLDSAGVEVHLDVWDMLWHVFEFYPDVPEADASLGHIADFLSDYC